MPSDKWTPELLKQHYDERLAHLQDEIVRELDGFPQEYAKRADVEVLRNTLDAIRTDHVQRREYDDLKTTITESRGGRVAIAASATIIVSILLLAFGILERGIPTTDEIVGLIKTTAPWLDDRPEINARINHIEEHDAILHTQIQKLEDRIKTLCLVNDLKGC